MISRFGPSNQADSLVVSALARDAESLAPSVEGPRDWYSTQMRLTALTLLLMTNAYAVYGQVHVLSASEIITKPANYFDLQDLTLRFTPSGGGYQSERLPAFFVEPGLSSRVLGPQGRITAPYSASWPSELPFPFPFGGKTYRSIFVNLNGNVSFDAPETANLPNGRNPWPDGTVRRMATSFDGRTLGDLERVINVFWNLYSTASIVKTEVLPGDRFAVTWDAIRPRGANVGYTPLGHNVFQVVLYSTGQIDLTYQSIAEKDGIVGLFQGAPSDRSGTRLDFVDRPNTAAEPVVAIKKLELTDRGTSLRWRFTMGAPTPATIGSGQLWYRVFLTLRGQNCEISLGYLPDGPRTAFTCGGGGTLAYRNENGTVDLVVSKLMLDGANSFSWSADAVWFGFPGRSDQVNMQSRRPIQLTNSQANPETDFSSATAAPVPREGNLFEIFHYPAVNKDLATAPRAAYRQFGPADDFFVPMLDFRPDDLFNHGPSTGQIGAGPRVTNIGNASNPQDFGSGQIQVAISPLYYNGPRLAEWVNDGRRDYFNYAQAVGWIAHEITHRWTAFLAFRDPQGRNTPLAAGSHWLPELNVPAVHKIWSDYSFSEYPERSVMDGGLYEELPNGRFRQMELTYIMPAGFSGVDLYAMGFMSAEEMPETFLIRNRLATGPNEFSGTKVAVRGPDIVAALGPRGPSAENSQKEFKLGVYLFHDPDAAGPDPDVLSNVRQITLQTMKFFSRATGGRMMITTSAPIDVLAPVIESVTDSTDPTADITAGSVVFITGSALAVKETAAPDFVPEWNGTSVTIDGRPATVRQVSPERLEVRLPAEVAGEEVTFEVTTRRGPSETFKNRISPVATMADLTRYPRQ